MTKDNLSEKIDGKIKEYEKIDDNIPNKFKILKDDETNQHMRLTASISVLKLVRELNKEKIQNAERRLREKVSKDILNQNKVKKFINKFIDEKGIPREFVFNEKHFYSALELIKEELLEEINKIFLKEFGRKLIK